METDVQNDDLDVSLKQDGKTENGKYTLLIEIIILVYINNIYIYTSEYIRYLNTSIVTLLYKYNKAGMDYLSMIQKLNNNFYCLHSRNI